jgi:hypothetical protein
MPFSFLQFLSGVEATLADELLIPQTLSQSLAPPFNRRRIAAGKSS